MSTPLTIFFLGATGYIGSQILISLAQDISQFHIVALVRAPTAEKEALLKTIYADLSVVEGTLDDTAIIREQAAKVDIVINAASSDHLPSVEAILAGLEKPSESKTGKAPLYIHLSGLNILSDSSYGEQVVPEDIPEYSDIGFDLNQCPPTNPHLPCDKAIMSAGTRKENPIRTIIIVPGWTFGIGDGIQKTTSALRIMLPIFHQVGYACTVGPGSNRMNNIHVKDVASALLAVLKAALEGKADEGAEGIYFAVSMEPKATMHDVSSKISEVLHGKGLLKTGGVQSLSREVVDAMGRGSSGGGNKFAKPDKLTRLGWEAHETRKISIMNSLPVEIEEVLRSNFP